MEYNKYDMDYQSKLLFAKPIEFEGFKIYPLTIEEIVQFSFDNYNKFLSIISYSKTDIMEVLKILEPIPLFEFIILLLISDETNETKDWFLGILSLIFRETTVLSVRGNFLVGKKVINENNFTQIIQIIKDQNFVKEREEKYLTKKEREYKEKLAEIKAKYKEYVNATERDKSSDILDIASAVSAKHPSLNLINIYKLTIYQLIDQFKRINAIDDYFISVDSLLAGADSKEIKLSHWSNKLTE